MLSLITWVFSLSDDFIDSWFDYCNLWTAHGFSLEIVIIPSTFNMLFLVLFIPGNCLVIAVWRFCGGNNLNKVNQMLADRSKVSQRGLHWALLTFKHWLTVILFNQSWTGKRSKGLSEPSFCLGEEADQLLSGEAADGNDLQETGINPAVVCSYLTTEPWLKPIFNPLFLFLFFCYFILFLLIVYFWIFYTNIWNNTDFRKRKASCFQGVKGKKPTSQVIVWADLACSIKYVAL